MKKMREFLEKAVATGSSECIEWPFSKDKNGYGWANLFGMKRAHRVAFMMKNGEFDRTKHVLHKCDNPACVNPEHLFLGTHKDNMADMKAKGRVVAKNNYPTNACDEHPKAKLTKEKVLEIRRKFSQREATKTELSRAYSVSHQTICDAINRVTWNF